MRRYAPPHAGVRVYTFAYARTQRARCPLSRGRHVRELYPRRVKLRTLAPLSPPSLSLCRLAPSRFPCHPPPVSPPTHAHILSLPSLGRLPPPSLGRLPPPPRAASPSLLPRRGPHHHHSTRRPPHRQQPAVQRHRTRRAHRAHAHLRRYACRPRETQSEGVGVAGHLPWRRGQLPHTYARARTPMQAPPMSCEHRAPPARVCDMHVTKRTIGHIWTCVFVCLCA